MSNYQEFCEMYSGDASDPGFMDQWIKKYLSDDTKEETNIVTHGDILKKGKLVHIIKLIASHPARPIGIIWNKKLDSDLSCNNANFLKGKNHQTPRICPISPLRF